MSKQIASIFSTALLLVATGCSAACAATEKSSSAAREKSASPANAKSFSGLADYYADMYHGRPTASGALHDKTKLMAAHRTLPFGTRVRIVNRLTKKSCIVVINDRGPFTKNKVIDVSRAAAQELGLFSCKTRMVDCSVVDKRTEAPLEEIACSHP